MSARARSITVPIVLLVLGAALLAVSVQFAIMFRGPPPGMGPPLPITRAAEILRTGIVPAERARQLTLRTVLGDQFGREDERSSPRRDAAIARQLDVPADKVRGFYNGPGHDPENDLFGSFTVAVQTGKGWTVLATADRPAFTRWHLVRILTALATVALLTLLAWIVAARISGPLRRLATAATQMRLGARATIPREGPREVRALAEALGAMQERILQQAENRSAMLGAIAHDLGTPLSRIAFWIEQLPETARDRASADLDEMRAMLGAALRFTRDGSGGEAHERLDLGSLIDSLADDLAAASTPVTAEPGPRLVVRGDSAALRRLFANLIENAVRYGERATVAWRAEGGWAEATVDDAGPGFDLAKAESLFSPFVRGESSRNRATGGTGLGLAIVRGIAEGHGGRVTLENRAGGGGRVRVRLPLV